MGHFLQTVVPGQDTLRVNAGLLIEIFLHLAHGVLAAYVFQDSHANQVCLGVCDIALMSGILHLLDPFPEGMKEMAGDHHIKPAVPRSFSLYLHSTRNSRIKVLPPNNNR